VVRLTDSRRTAHPVLVARRPGPEFAIPVFAVPVIVFVSSPMRRTAGSAPGGQPDGAHQARWQSAQV